MCVREVSVYFELKFNISGFLGIPKNKNLKN